MNLKKEAIDNTMSTPGSNKHPKVSEMVLLAIAMLNDRNGSSVQAIKKYISSSFNVDGKKLSTYVKRYLMMAVASGTLIQTKGKGLAGSFRLGGGMKLKMSELLTKVPIENHAESSSSHCENKRQSTSKKSSKKLKKKKSPLRSTKSRAV